MRRSFVLFSTLLAAAGCGGRTAAPAAASAPAVRPDADPTNVRYGAGSGRYRFEQSLHVTRTVMGNVTEVDAATTLLISTALAAAEAGNLGATYTVDSVSVSSTEQGGAGAVEGSRGKTWRAVITPQGRSVTFTPPDSNPETIQTGELFREFLPALSTNLTPGTTWADTVRQTPNQAGMTIRTQSIRQNRVIGWEMHDGVRALKLATTGAITLAGEGESQGQQLQLNGTGTSVAERFVSAAGVFLGSTVHDSTNLNITLLSAGIDVPVVQIRSSTTTRLP